MSQLAIQPIQEQACISNDPDWWRGAVIYQIYIRSFQDSDGDGVGDLRGIISRLPYVASLGVDAVWIAPFFKSPMKDCGYDVANFREVDPLFGALSDFQQLLDRAHELGLKVMIDLAVSHTSDLHPWFAESRSSRDNPKSDWYVWADPKPDGSPPNNWLSIFGGTAWEWDGTRMQYYLHNFLTSQPDLNFHCEDVQNAVLDIARFWLEMGTDGFRLDTINFYFCDTELRDNPPLSEELRNSVIAPGVNPYNYQNHIYDKNRPENVEFLTRLRSVMDDYGAPAGMGEVGDAQRGLELIGEYTGDSKIHMCYSFEFLSGNQPTALSIVETLNRLGEAAPDGFVSWAFSNHDVERHRSRWDLDDRGLRLFATLIMCIGGSTCLFQGEEIGLPEANLELHDLRDPYGLKFWPEFKGRDGCRTPMIWSRSETNCGFSKSKPWLPISKAHRELSVETHEMQTDSLLNHYRWAITLRKKFSSIRLGGMERLEATGNVLSFIRKYEGESIFCAFNIGERQASISLLPGTWTSVAEPLEHATGLPREITLEGWASIVAIEG